VLLHVRETGPPDAPTVVLLHGVGTSGWMWRQLVRAVSDDLHVLDVDLPGHGESAARPWASMADTAAAVAELVTARAHDGAAHLVGLSLGGYLAADLAASQPHLVPSALCSGVNVLPFPRPRLVRAAGRAMAPLLGLGPVLRANARALGVRPEDFEGYARAARAMARGTFLRVGEELLDYRVPAGAGSSPSRVLAVAGGREHRLVLASLPRLAGAYPRGGARVAPGVGHAWNGEAPDLFARTVRAHVAGAPLPAELVAPAPADHDGQRRHP
jgi:pimeloyl-ACP methyl ester carboxylesterase